MGQRIVIIGGGFGGAFTARYLRKYAERDSQIELINSNNYFVFQPLLPEVVSGTISAPDAVTPLRYMLPGVQFRMAEVVGLDTATKTLNVLQGTKRIPQQVSYDDLVIAVGQRTNLDHTPGFREHSMCVRDLADAHELRNKIIRCLEHADITKDPDLKKRLLTFVVAGGGFSGVETIGEMIEMIKRTIKFYPNIDIEDVRAVLIQRGNSILPELRKRLGDYAHKSLTKRRVEIICNASIKSASATAVYLNDGRKFETETLITTVGNGPHPFVENIGIDLNRGKIPVDEYLRVLGQEKIWSLGDAALVPLGDEDEPRNSAPPTAQFAVAQARCLAKNIGAAQREQALGKFAYTPKGSLASIGNYRAVAEVFGIRISGLFAWLMWRGMYIGMLPGFSTRLRVALNWLFDYFLPRSIVQIGNRRASTTTYRCYAKGDVVSAPGQIPDGFYSVISGFLESRIPGPSPGEDFVRILGPGDHWGERTVSEGKLTKGTLTATEDARILVMAANDFRNLCEAFPALDEYFSSIDPKIYAPELR